MRDLLKIFICACLCASQGAFASVANTRPPITNPEKTILVDETIKSFTITLASTPSTGFSWLLQTYDPTIVKLVKHEYLSSTKTMPGASGIENWTFAINPNIIAGPQVTEISLINARPWNIKGTASKATVFTVVVN